ncbi:phage tail tip fiber protein [Carnimonas bestiolae]|uniref:phage tail tip fiber protein n=1 Tax=Carnimonas bestiolae TaxID=3402172 RepID=UPI003EDC929D
MRAEEQRIYDDAVGKPYDPVSVISLPTGGMSPPTGVRYDVEQIGEVMQGYVTWNEVAGALDYIVVVRSGKNAVQSTVIAAPNTRANLSGLKAGKYTVEVTARGPVRRSQPATINIRIDVPPRPDSVNVDAGNNEITLTPILKTDTLNGGTWEYWVSARGDLNDKEVEAKATYLSRGGSFTHIGLQVATTYHYWIRGVNAYGTGEWYKLDASTVRDPSAIIDAIAGEITEDVLDKDLHTEIDKISGDGKGSINERIKSATSKLDGEVNSAKGDAAKAQETADKANADLQTARQELGDGVKRAQKTADSAGADIQAARKELGTGISKAQQTADQARKDAKTASDRLDTTSNELIDRIEKNKNGITELSESVDQRDKKTNRRIDGMNSTVEGNTADLAEEKKTRANQYGALSSDLNAVKTQSGRNSSDIQSLRKSVSDGEKSVAESLDKIEASNRYKGNYIADPEFSEFGKHGFGMGTLVDAPDGKYVQRCPDNGEDIRSEYLSGIQAGITYVASVKTKGDINRVQLREEYEGPDGKRARRWIGLHPAARDGDWTTWQARRTIGEGYKTLQLCVFGTGDGCIGIKQPYFGVADAGVEYSSAQLTEEREARQQGDQATTKALTDYKSEVGKNLADITSQQKTLADGQSSQTQDLSSLKTRTGKNESRIDDVAETQSSDKKALTQQINTAQSTADNAKSAATAAQNTEAKHNKATNDRISDLSTTVDKNNADATRKISTLSDKAGAVAKDINNLKADTSKNSSDIKSLTTAQANDREATAQQINQLAVSSGHDNLLPDPYDETGKFWTYENQSGSVGRSNDHNTINASKATSALFLVSDKGALRSWVSLHNNSGQGTLDYETRIEFFDRDKKPLGDDTTISSGVKRVAPANTNTFETGPTEVPSAAYYARYVLRRADDNGKNGTGGWQVKRPRVEAQSLEDADMSASITSVDKAWRSADEARTEQIRSAQSAADKAQASANQAQETEAEHNKATTKRINELSSTVDSNKSSISDLRRTTTDELSSTAEQIENISAASAGSNGGDSLVLNANGSNNAAFWNPIGKSKLAGPASGGGISVHSGSEDGDNGFYSNRFPVSGVNTIRVKTRPHKNSSNKDGAASDIKEYLQFFDSDGERVGSTDQDRSTGSLWTAEVPSAAKYAEFWVRAPQRTNSWQLWQIRVEADSLADSDNAAQITSLSRAQSDDKKALTQQINAAQSTADNAKSAATAAQNTEAKHNKATNDRISDLSTTVDKNNANATQKISTLSDEAGAAAKDISNLKAETGKNSSDIKSLTKAQANDREATAESISNLTAATSGSNAGDSLVRNANGSNHAAYWNPIGTSSIDGAGNGTSGLTIHDEGNSNGEDNGACSDRFPVSGLNRVRMSANVHINSNSGGDANAVKSYLTFYDSDGNIVGTSPKDANANSSQVVEVPPRAYSADYRAVAPNGTNSWQLWNIRVEADSLADSDNAAQITSVDKAWRSADKSRTEQIRNAQSAADNAQASANQAQDTAASNHEASIKSINQLRTTVDSNTSAIENVKRTQANDKKALSEQIDTVQAELSSDNNLVRDPDFSRDQWEATSYVHEDGALSIRGNGKQPYVKSWDFPVTGGQTYLYSCQVKSVSKTPTNYYINVEFIDSNGHSLSWGNEGRAVSDNVAEWTTISGRSTAPKNAAKARLQAGARNNDFWFSFRAPRCVSASDAETVDNIASVQQYLSANAGPGGAQAGYTLKTDVNGHVMGFGAYNDGKTSRFIINADVFAISQRGVNGSEIIPFLAKNGVAYLNEAMIGHGTIGRAQITDYLQSDGYYYNSPSDWGGGLMLDFKAGKFYASGDVHIKGEIHATSGTFSGTVKAAKVEAATFARGAFRFDCGGGRLAASSCALSAKYTGKATDFRDAQTDWFLNPDYGSGYDENRVTRSDCPVEIYWAGQTGGKGVTATLERQYEGENWERIDSFTYEGTQIAFSFANVVKLRGGNWRRVRFRVACNPGGYEVFILNLLCRVDNTI